MIINVLQWRFADKAAFRFAFILLFLFIIVFNNGAFVLLEPLAGFITAGLHVFIPWFAKNFLHLPEQISQFTNGSGDTTYDYVVLLVITLAAVAGCIIWTFTDRKRANYNRLFYWLTVAVRFYLGMMLIQYGLYKVIKTQFPSPGFYRLLSTYGDSSPMGLAWTFLGYSKGYNLFMGVAELMGGLLFFRKTVTLGAIISLMTAANVMAVNYFYDVPVKIVSTGMVMMCLFLLLPNFSRLFQFFIKGEPAKLRSLVPPVISRRWLYYGRYVVKYLFIILGIGLPLAQIWGMRTQYGDGAPKSPLYGAYEVNTFTIGNDTLKTGSNATKTWKWLLLENTENAVIRYAGKESEWVKINADTVHHRLSFVFKEDVKNAITYQYTKPDSLHLILTSKPGKDRVRIELTKKQFLLQDRKFNWVNEVPFNR